MLHDTSCLLSSLTHYAAMVVAPHHEDATVRSVQIVGLGTRVALVVAVLSTGAIEKATLELDDGVGDEHLAAAAAHLNAHLVGFPITDDRPILPTGNDATDRLVAAARTGLVDHHRREAEQVFVDGASHMAATFEAVATVRQVLTILEQQYVVVSLLREALHDDRLNVVIGTEHRVESLAECSHHRRPLRGRRGPGRHHRRARPHPHELPPGHGRGRRRQPAPGSGPQRELSGAPWPTTRRTSTTCWA